MLARPRLDRRSPARIDCTFQRVQFTSDMLPSDVVGISIYSAARTAIRIQAWPRLCQRFACRRNQPHDAENAISIARGHERGPSHDRRPLAPVASAVPRDRNAKSCRASWDLSTARVATRSFPDARPHGISRRQAEREILRSAAGARIWPTFVPFSPGQMSSRCNTPSISSSRRLSRQLRAWRLSATPASLNSLSLGVSPRGSQALYRVGPSDGVP